MDKYLDSIFDKTEINIKLDEYQKQVVLDESENIIVVAGAGSGKTTTITAKIKYLVEIKKIKEKEILVISFTNRAIYELKSRINGDFKIDAKICTFHKFAYDVLKMHNNSYRIITDSMEILKRIIKEDNQTNKVIKILLKDKDYKKRSYRYNSDLDYFINFTIDNLNLYKINKDNIKNIEKERIRIYLSYLDKITSIYNNYLKDNNYLDFEDLIIEATKIIKQVKLNYKYIIIDEYQDISYNRFNLIKEIVSLYKIKTVVVGDDWQAIYSFAGSDLNLFTSYQISMKANMYKIVNTYRNSQELIDIAGRFIMKNKKQISKQLLSNKTILNPIQIYETKSNLNELFIKILNQIIKEYGLEKNILVLGRYNVDYKKIICDNIIVKKDKIIYNKYKTLEIDYMTIHQSKGLGYDNVIIINGLNDIYGFPSKIKNDEIKNSLINKEDTLLEERRLFYVAITRTKNKVYILTQKNKVSVFIKEISNNKNVIYNKKM